MTDAPAPIAWPRPHFAPSTLRMKNTLVCFADAPLALGTFRASAFGAPSKALAEAVDLRRFERRSCAVWFEGWFNDAFGVCARADLGDDYGRLAASRVCYSLELDLEDQPDLAPVQTIWALARWLVESGAEFVLDLAALRYRNAGAVSALRYDALDVEQEVSITVETEATHGAGHLMHTRGMKKFGRPDIVTWDTPDRSRHVAARLNTMAQAMAEGALPEQLRIRDEGQVITLAPFGDTALLAALGIDVAVQVQVETVSA